MFRFYLAVLTAATIALAPFPTGLFLYDAPTTPRITILGYDRQRAFGSWGHVPGTSCTTREAAVAAAWDQPCDVPYHQWDAHPIRDPYTGAAMLPGDVQVDHVYPLSAAWDMGAHAWPPEKRAAFANDPANLAVISASVNQAKSDMLPGEWMPPDWRAGCAYSRQLAGVAAAYGLPLSREDVRAMRRSCAGLKGLLSVR